MDADKGDPDLAFETWANHLVWRMQFRFRETKRDEQMKPLRVSFAARDLPAPVQAHWVWVPLAVLSLVRP
jgi:hypothetical protein